jgi:hypothetical protein
MARIGAADRDTKQRFLESILSVAVSGSLIVDDWKLVIRGVLEGSVCLMWPSRRSPQNLQTAV